MLFVGNVEEEEKAAAGPARSLFLSGDTKILL